MAFRGSAPAKIDDRGRIKIPSAFRREFAAAPEVFVTCLDGPAVLLYPMRVYEEQIEEELDARAGLNAEPARILRRLNANGMATQVDGQGRVTLGQDLRERTGLMPGCEIRVIGMRDYLELWTEAAYEREENPDGV